MEKHEESHEEEHKYSQVNVFDSSKKTRTEHGEELNSVEAFFYNLINEFGKADICLLFETGIEKQQIQEALDNLIKLELIIALEENQKTFFKIKEHENSKLDEKKTKVKRTRQKSESLEKNISESPDRIKGFKERTTHKDHDFEVYRSSISFFSYHSDVFSHHSNERPNYVSMFIRKLAKKFNPVVIKRKRARFGRRMRRVTSKKDIFNQTRNSGLEEIVLRARADKYSGHKAYNFNRSGRNFISGAYISGSYKSPEYGRSSARLSILNAVSNRSYGYAIRSLGYAKI